MFELLKFWLFNIPYPGPKMVFIKLTAPLVLRVIFVDQMLLPWDVNVHGKK